MKFDRLPPSRAEVKNEHSCTSPPPYAVMAWSGTSLLFYLVSVLNLNKSNFFLGVIAVKRTCLERNPQGSEDFYFVSELSLTLVQKLRTLCGVHVVAHIRNQKVMVCTCVR